MLIALLSIAETLTHLKCLDLLQFAAFRNWHYTAGELGVNNGQSRIGNNLMLIFQKIAIWSSLVGPQG